MSIQAPKIDDRSYEKIISEVQEWAEIYTAVAVHLTRGNLTGRILHETIDAAAIPPLVEGTRLEGEALEALLTHSDLKTVQVKRWQADPDNMDAGSALIQIFARMAAVVIDRLNRVPDKNFLAFLDLVGAQLNPPQPARVPLSFQLAEGSPVDARVPAGTQVAAPPDEAVTEEVTYETDAELTVVRTQLAYAFVHDSYNDTYTDASDVARGKVSSQFSAFIGDTPIEHSLYIPVANEFFNLIKNRNLSLAIISDMPQRLKDAPLKWTYWDGKAWQKAVGPVVSTNNNSVIYDFNGTTKWLEFGEFQGLKARWLRAQYDGSLQHGLVNVTHTLTGTNATNIRPVEPGKDFNPFGDDGNLYLYLRLDLNNKPDDPIHLKILTTTELPYPAGLDLAWEFYSASKWQKLGHSQNPEALPGPNDFHDSTLAFTRSGEVSFTPPTIWQSQTFSNYPEGYWLRVYIATDTNYEPPPNIRFPLVYPHFGSANVIWSNGITNFLPPQKALFNQTEIDLSKDFYPFGETPKFNDTFYLALDEAFAAPGFQVTLNISLTSDPQTDEKKPREESADTPKQKEVILPSAEVRWEYWDLKEMSWQPLTVEEPKDVTGQSNFTHSGSLQFIIPENCGFTEVNGERRFWIRARIVAGTYGTKEHYVQQEVQMGDTKVKVNVFVPANYNPPSIQSIKIVYAGIQTDQRRIEPYYVYNDFTFSRTAGNGADFLPMKDPQPTLYLGFDKPFPNRACQVYFEVQPEEASPTLIQPTEPPHLMWEYMAADKTWKRLGIRDETRAFTRRGLVSFLGPADASESTEFEKKAYWMRVRWEGGSYAAPPRLTRILTNTTWATQAITQQAELLGSGNGEKNQIFHTARTPVLNGQSLEIRELDILPESERENIESEEGVDAVQVTLDSSGLPESIWVRWHEVPDFYASGANNRHYVLDHQTGEVRFGDGLHGKVPPQGRANIRATYRSGGGVSGNRPARVVAELKTAVPYIDSVLNYSAAEGGAEAETLNKLLQRGPRIIRHRNRAVVPQDFEDLAFLASPQIARARTIAASDNASAGHVKLIIVPEGRQARPAPTLELVTRVTDYLLARCDPTLSLHVSGPKWISISIEADIVPSSLEATNTIIASVDSAISAFLHPLTGGVDHQGWLFGRQPQQSDLFRLIEGIKEVDHVHRLSIQADDTESESSLIYSGTHKISLISLESLGE